MSRLPSAFKRKDHGKMADFSSIPAGDYIAKIIESDYVPTAKKDGHRLKLTFEIQNKEFKGKKIFAGLNLDNPSESAVELANNELATICDAAGKGAIKDSNQLHGILMIITLKIIPADGKYSEGNKIIMYSSMEKEEDDIEEDDIDDEDIEEDDIDDEDDDEDDDEEDDEDTTSHEEVSEKARTYKKATSLKLLKKMLSEYDIEKISQISKLSEDDLEALNEDLDDEL